MKIRSVHVPPPLGRGVAVLVALGVILTGCSDVGDDPEVQEAMAFEMCKDFVKDRLKAPATAAFPDYWDKDGEVSVTRSGDTYTVVSHVDAQNSFGALLSNDFECEVTNVEGDRWRLEALDM